MRTTITNAKLSATINHKGAELVSLQNIDSKKEFIWEGNPEYWGKHSPILFPIVGTLKNNTYTYNGNVYNLSRHGFARDMNFDLISLTENEAVFSLKSNQETKALYPFDFELQIIYTLIDAELNIRYRILNTGSEALFYAIGGHPAFALSDAFEHYSLQFVPNENLISYELENDLLSDKTKKIELDKGNLPLNYWLFEKDALIFKELKSNQIQLLHGVTPILNFKFNDFPNFGIWTKIGAPFICLEPWVGYSDTLNTNGNITEKEGAQKLQNNTSMEYSFSVEIL